MLTPGDIAAAAVAYLSTALPAATVAAERPVGWDWQTTTPTLVVVTGSGGTVRDQVLADATLAVEVWCGPGPGDAATVCAALSDWVGRWAGLLIYGADCALPNLVPDPDTGAARYVMAATTTSRLLGA